MDSCNPDSKTAWARCALSTLQNCPNRVDRCLSIESALSLRNANAANRIALDAKIWAIIAAIIAIIAVYIQK